jgi:signal transduction histidine kinase
MGKSDGNLKVLDESGELAAFGDAGPRMEAVNRNGNSTSLPRFDMSANEMKSMAIFAEQNPGPVMRVGMDGVIQYANLAAIEVFDLYAGVKTPICGVMPCAANFNMENCVRTNSLIEFTSMVGNRYFQFAIKGVAELGVVQIYGTDVTRQKEVEDKLRSAKQAAEKATKLKDDFVSLVAHDLKTPFTSIIGLLRVLRSDANEPLGEAQKAKLDMVLSSSYNMVDLINNLLDSDRLQSGDIVLQKTLVGVSGVVEENFLKLRHLAVQKGVALENRIPEALSISADPNLFAVVLQNLISNGIKFSNRGGMVKAHTVEGEPFKIAVSDTGVGMSLSVLKSFHGGTSLASSRGTEGENGTGFGLKIAAQVMKAHGGSLRAESKPGEGTTFYLEFPAQNSPLASPMEGKHIN